MNTNVYFRLTKFVSYDGEGKEVTTYGYVLYDHYIHYYQDTWSLERFNTVTPIEVLSLIEEYEDFYENVLDNGFYFNEKWIPVDETGTMMH